MKKLLALILALGLVISLAACGSDGIGRETKSSGATVSGSASASTSENETTSIPESQVTSTSKSKTTATTENTTLDSETERVVGIYRGWYDRVIKGFKQEELSKTAAEANIDAEYRVVYNVAMQRYDYYSLRVFTDGTGEIHYMVHKSEDFQKGEIILNETKALSAAEVKSLTNVIEKNDFFNIPTIHPDEVDGCDGKTIFIEGYKDGKFYFIKMWEPDAQYGIYKIHKAFADFGDTIAERPEIRFR